MARNTNNSNNNNSRPEADAFLNVYVVDKDGVERRIGSRGIPLFNTSRVDRSVINHINGAGEDHKLNIVTKMVMNTDDSGEDDFAL